jgi:hypothetical protein
MRVQTYENASVVTEVLAPSTEIQWNPEDNTGQLVFRCERYTFLDGQRVGRTPVDPLVVPLAQVFGRVFDTVAGPIPAEVVMLGIKAAFDTLWSEEQERLANTPEVTNGD